MKYKFDINIHNKLNVNFLYSTYFHIKIQQKKDNFTEVGLVSEGLAYFFF